MSKAEEVVQAYTSENQKQKPANSISREDMRGEEAFAISVKQLEFNLAIVRERCLRTEQKLDEQQFHAKEITSKKREAELRLLEQIKQLKIRNKKWQVQYQKLKKELELKKIVQKEQNRVVFSAAIHHTQQQLEKVKLEFEQEFMSECEELRMQIKEKDEKMRLTLKKLHNYHSNYVNVQEEYEEYGKIVSFIKDIGNIEELNATIHKLKVEILNLKKEVKDFENKLAQSQMRNDEIMQSMSNFALALEKKELEERDLKEEIITLENQLQKEKAENRQLETYFSQKWVKEFEIFRIALQKAYEGRLIKLRSQFEAKMASIHNNEQTFLNLHKADEKAIQSLETEINVLTTEIKESRQIIVKLQFENVEIKQEMKESNKMIAEFEKSIHAQSLEKLQQKELEIEEMKKIISNADIAKQAFDSKLNKLRKTLKESFDNQKKSIEANFARERQELTRTKDEEWKSIMRMHEQDLMRLKSRQETLLYQNQKQMAKLQTKYQKEANQLKRQLEQSRNSLREASDEAQNRQKQLINEFQQTRKHSIREVEKQKKDIQQKVIAIKGLHQRARHDQNLKRQLRCLYDIKSKEYNQLLKENQELTQDLIQKQYKINQLNHAMLSNDWQQILTELRNQFKIDLFALNEIHWKQIQIFRTKVQELQSIICRRHSEDHETMANLYHQNEMLQTKLDLFQRKRSEQSQSLHTPALSSINFIQPRKNLFVNKRKKRGNFHISHSILQNPKESSTAAAIIRMKRFLERGKSTDTYSIVGNSQRYFKNAGKSSHANLSTQR